MAYRLKSDFSNLQFKSLLFPGIGDVDFALKNQRQFKRLFDIGCPYIEAAGDEKIPAIANPDFEVHDTVYGKMQISKPFLAEMKPPKKVIRKPKKK